MEYSWIVFAIGGLISAGLMDFINKLVLQKGIDKETYLFTSWILYAIVFGIYAYIFGTGSITLQSVLYAAIYGLTVFGTALGIITAYKYTTVGFAIVSIRLIASFLILIAGMTLIGDTLTLGNIVGFIIGMIAVFFLSGWERGGKISIHPKGIAAIVLAIVSIVCGHTFYKIIIDDINIIYFTSLQVSFGFAYLCVYLFFRKKLFTLRFDSILKSLPYGLIASILFILFAFYFLPNIYLYGPLSLGYKILSYSLLIPILLSILFLGEPINKTRIFAFGLTVISIFLFL